MKPGERGEAGKRTKAGMSRKQKEISIYDRPIKVLGNKAVGDFVPRDGGETNPRGLKCAVAIRYKNSGENKPRPVMFRAVYRLQRKWARFSANLNANDPSRIPSLYPSMLPPSLEKTTGENRRGVRQLTDHAPLRAGGGFAGQERGRAPRVLRRPSWPSSPDVETPGRG